MKQTSEQKSKHNNKYHRKSFFVRFIIFSALMIFSVFQFLDAQRRPLYNKEIENSYRVVSRSGFDRLTDGENVKGRINKEDVIEYFTVYDDKVSDTNTGYLAVHTPENNILVLTASEAVEEEMYINMKKMMSSDTDSLDYCEFEGYVDKTKDSDPDIKKLIKFNISKEKLKEYNLDFDNVSQYYICGFPSPEPFSQKAIMMPYIMGSILLILAIFMLTKPAEKLTELIIRMVQRFRKKPPKKEYFVLTEAYKGSICDPFTSFTAEQEEKQRKN